MRPEPARYFPVEPTRLRMRAGLHPFGEDFGNGDADALYFQVDREYEHYLEAKATPARARGSAPWLRHALIDDSPGTARAHRAVRRWLEDTLVRECPDILAPAPPGPGGAQPGYDELFRRLQEDAVVIQREPEGPDRAIMVHVCFPSGWRPERILGWSFQRIHRPVPGFADTPPAAARMLSAMIERGPYVRFVWTISANDVLDHHPDQGMRTAWTHASRAGWLRVERQVSVPFPDVNAALFLIRIYLYPFESLAAEEQRDLRSALRAMPDAVRRYKGLAGELDHALAVLKRSAAGSRA